jgi:hypothetical protein
VGRLNANGTLDTAFDPIPAAHPGSCTLVGIIVQPDGKIIIAGLVTQVKDSGGATVVRQGIARLNPDGSVDAAYYPGVSGLNIRTMALDHQGRLLVGGNFSLAGHGVRRRHRASRSRGSSPTARWTRRSIQASR